MKKYFSLLSLITLLLVFFGCKSNKIVETVEKEEKQTYVHETKPVKFYKPDAEFPDAQTLAKEMGIGINLGNTMEAYDATNCEKITFTWIPVVGNNTPIDYEKRWHCVQTTQECIDGMKAAGFDTVRIPVFWGNMMENDDTWTINPEYINRVREIVDYCQNAELIAVINCHHFDEFIIRRHSIDESVEIFKILWTQIAEYFKDYPYTVVFEGFNEYLGGKQFNARGYLVDVPRNKAYEMANRCNQAFVDAVRATGGKNAERVLIASGYWTNIDLTTSPKFLMPEDTIENRLMISVHYVDNSMYWSNKIGTSEWKSYIEDQCSKLKKAFLDKNIPVFLGETTAGYPPTNFGGYPEVKTSSECIEYVMNRLLDDGMVPVLWDTNSHFYERTECRIKDEANRMMIERVSQRVHQ